MSRHWPCVSVEVILPWTKDQGPFVLQSFFPRQIGSSVWQRAL